MGQGRSITVGGNSVGTIFTTGDANTVIADVDAGLTRVTLPPPSSIDITWELEQMRSLLETLSGEDSSKARRALDDAIDEAKKKDPNKDEIGSALNRALDYAKKSGELAEQAVKCGPHIVKAVSWLGANWHKLLAVAGLAV